MQTLSADTADGRAMGSAGEKATGDLMISGLSSAGARPKGDNNGWLQTFTIDDGRQIANSQFTVDDHTLVLSREWFPLTLCPAGEVKGSPAPALQESGVPWFVDLKETLENAASNPGYDLAAEIRAKAAACAKKGATALILYNSSHSPDKLKFDPKDKPEAAVIPVVYITHEAKRKYFKDESDPADIKIHVGYSEKTRSGHNVIGFIDNGAPTTVVIASRYNNSSGLAGMIALARMLAVSKLKANNYLFIVLSGWGPEWPGAGYYCSHPVVDAGKLNYALEINRLAIQQENDKFIFIGGASTSATWTDVENALRVKKSWSTPHNDSVASHPGIQAFFVRQQIPALALSTAGGDSVNAAEELKLFNSNPSGELHVIKSIFSMIEAADPKGKLVFTQ